LWFAVNSEATNLPERYSSAPWMKDGLIPKSVLQATILNREDGRSSSLSPVFERFKVICTLQRTAEHYCLILYIYNLYDQNYLRRSQPYFGYIRINPS
jgi:hypothetical protein